MDAFRACGWQVTWGLGILLAYFGGVRWRSRMNGEKGHAVEAEKIAEDGREWAAKVWGRRTWRFICSGYC